ncbi:hypothetical protein [Paraglaciecola sp.]|uniref:hypothetical protein n=1 Tax=Paraglaciecola sp. TaxID=1920173 RepID=UPI0030F47C76
MSKIRTTTPLKIISGILLSFLVSNAKANPSDCPSEFYQLPLVTSATYCQLFNQALPASLSYFVATSPSDAKAFYLAALGEPEQEFTEKGRAVLLYKGGVQTIIISIDKQGSQVDILVKQ